MGDWGDVGLELVASAILTPKKDEKGWTPHLNLLNVMVTIYRDVTELVRRI